MLASNFRFATEDLDVAEIEKPWPAWLSQAVADIAARNGWSESWLNDAVTFHLSPLARPERDLVPFGTFPRLSSDVGLSICIPTARYMLALKLKALRVSETKGADDISDVANLLATLGIDEIEPAIDVLGEFFPKTAQDADKQRFVLKRVLSKGMSGHAPATLAKAVERVIAGEPQEFALPEFLDNILPGPHCRGTTCDIGGASAGVR